VYPALLAACLLPCKLGDLRLDGDWRLTGESSARLGTQDRLAFGFKPAVRSKHKSLLHQKPSHGAFDATSDREDPVVLQDQSLVPANGLDNRIRFVLG